MWRELLVAVPAAAAVGLLAFTYSEYEYWRSWTPRRFKLGFSFYLLLNAASGALGVGLAALLSWEPLPGKWYANGLIFAGAGQALLRVEPHGFGIDKLNTGRSILARGVDFVIEMQDKGVEDRLSQRFQGLSDGQLFDLALYLYEKIVAGDPGIPDETKRLTRSGLVEAGEELASNERAAARGSLERFCLRQIADRHLPPAQTGLDD
jgi:hypothetical protein